MVALSPASMKELGAEIPAEDAGKSFHEVSGRKGLGVKADDLLNLLEEKAFAEVDKRNTDLPRETKKRTAREIACGALRYFMLKFTRNALIIFDFDEALSFEGETGPYLQYTCVRLNSIFRKLREREGLTAEAVDGLVRGPAPALNILSETERPDAWELLTFAAQFEDEVQRSLESLEFNHTAKFAFALAQKCNGYYHKYPILNEPDAGLKTVRIQMVAVVRDALARALDIMGIPVPERM
jgi:arginyl-tRNA synthetase